MDASPTKFPEPAGWYDRLLLRYTDWEACDGVPVTVGSFRNEAALRARVAEALGLVAVYAPADLDRVRKLMRGIVIARLHGSQGVWRQSLRVCVISMRYLQTAPSEAVAATIIHELTHARLDALGFDYSEESRPRVERICFRASKRFLERLPESIPRNVALEEVTEFLAFDLAVLRAVLRRAYRPWYVRAVANAVQRVTRPWHRDVPS